MARIHAGWRRCASYPAYHQMLLSPLKLIGNTKVTIWISMEVDEVSDSVEFLWVILPRLINLFS
ncbi:hypothetical protein MJI95_11675, partial [Salmonella enterica subsp. enterica serovar Kentucky]|nr:hypothetical protein [Salmonella enterica subsp. enterica serovar Kentucky]